MDRSDAKPAFSLVSTQYPIARATVEHTGTGMHLVCLHTVARNVCKSPDRRVSVSFATV